MASTEFSKESMDPLRTAVIPSSTVKHGCQGIKIHNESVLFKDHLQFWPVSG